MRSRRKKDSDDPGLAEQAGDPIRDQLFQSTEKGIDRGAQRDKKQLKMRSQMGSHRFLE